MTLEGLREELEVMRALEIVLYRLQILERLGHRCSDEPIDDDLEGSSVHPAPSSSDQETIL